MRLNGEVNGIPGMIGRETGDGGKALETSECTACNNRNNKVMTLP